MDNYADFEFIGKGSRSQVYSVLRLSDMKPFAAKFMPATQENMKECIKMLELQSEEIVECEDYFINSDREQRDQIVLIMEQADSDLQTYINETEITETDICRILA